MDGSVVDLPAHKIQLKGGSDKDGVPMIPNVHGGVRRKVVLSGGVGFKAKKRGERKRKAVRGNVITDDIVQINIKIVEQPKNPKAENVEQTKPEAQPA